ncbi:MAG: hypothetical protein A2X12_05825 [Bacteroidetes bacterium GWE2_29_8]|nr:MAG: hypothetical protein A2X12_05825 [Bacteroidetes bacterium GWE2_29_8]OFY17627.1 MAG: hypothetical protein A2X02_07850 [Bacteroidetes bacterium GWF2_29_10]
MFKLKVLINIFLLAILLTSCKVERKLIKEPIKPKEEGLTYVFDNLKNNELKFNTLNIKFTATLTIDKKSNTFNGQIRMLKDSIIWMSITPAFGIEMARVLITPDTIKLINRLESQYFSGSFDFLNGLFKTSIDYDILQAYLTGNDFHYYENNSFKISINNMQYLLSTIGRGKLRKATKTKTEQKIMLQNIWLDPRTSKITKMSLNEIAENKKVEASYVNYTPIDNQLVPMSILIEVNSQNDKIKLDLKYSKITLNEDINFPFNIPSKYESMK